MLVEWIFSKLYKAYEYPFERSDRRIAGMNEAERTAYYLSCKRVVDERAYTQEMQEAVRHFYQELSLKTDSRTKQDAYRLTLKFIQDLDKRLKALSTLYKPPAISKVADQFK